MKIRATVHDSHWRYLATALDARWLLFVFFVAVLVLPFLGIQQNSSLDQNLFRLGVKLQSQSPDGGSYLRVDVPADEMQRFLHDPISAAGMMAFLTQLQSSNMRSAKLVLHEKLWTEYKLNALLEHAGAMDAAVPLEALPTLKKNINTFQSFLTDRRITRENIANDVWPASSLFPKLPFFSIGSGHVVPENSRYGVTQLSDQGARRILQDKTVVIGEIGDLYADDVLLNIISMDNSNFATLSPWYTQLHLAIMACLFFYLLLLPFMSIKVSSVLSLLFIFSLLFSQQIVFILHREWFPISNWLLFLIAGHGMVLLWCVRKSFYITEKISDAHRMVPVVKTASVWKLWNATKKKTAVRIPPTVMGRNTLDDFEETEILPRAKSINRAASLPANHANTTRQHLGRYRIERELGRGAMGVVYLGFDPKISRKVAIKTLHYNQFEAGELPAVKERFFREAAAAGKLRHPNIVTIYDAGEESDLAYIAMDYVGGVSLAAHVRKGQLLDVELVYYIMALVTDAVNEANSQGIIHRDIKPSNILYDAQTNEVKVADFGIARILDGSVTRTKTGELVGSPLYMSPEQIKGEQVSKQSDIFSMGVTFYQLLTGELPFKGDSLANLSYQIVQCKYKSVDEVRPDLPDSARRIIAKALQKNPDSRYVTAAEMHDALQKAYSRDF